MDERKSKSSEIKNKKPKTAGSNVVSAEKRFASNRPFKEETPKKILNNNTDKAKKSAKEKETEEIERRRFLLDDEFFEEEKTDKPQKEKTPEKKGRVIGEINAKTGKKKKKKKKKKKAQIPNAAAFIAIAAVLMLVLSFFILRVKTINITGNVKKTEEEIIALSQIKKGDHMWFFNTEIAEKQIETDPYIAFSEVDRSYPNTVNIKVTEKLAAAVIQSVSAYAVIDSKGYVLSIDDAASYDDILNVSGMGATGYKVGTYLGDENDFMARTLLSILDAMEKSGIKESVKSLDISNPMSIEMVMKNGIRVHMGQSEDAQKKFEKLVLVLPWLEQNGYLDGTVDISAKGDPVYSLPTTPTPIPTPTPTPTPIPEETEIPKDADQ